MNDKTIKFFKEISKIPRESGNEEQISEYICNFAKDRNLEYIKDKYNNVIIKKYTGKNEPIILQAHLDMVCEKIEGLNFNFETDSLEIYEENGYLKAKGTTLGADNGIGVAQILNILDSDLNINIEAIFTVSEETTMIGAENINVSMLKGKKMINLDGFDAHTIITESASFFDIVVNMNYTNYKTENDSKYKISLSGLEGGHSGFDIDKDKGNSIKELAELLKKISNIRISNFIGGTKFNVIPSKAVCVFSTDIQFEKIQKIIRDFCNEKKMKYKDIKIIVEKLDITCKFLSEKESKKLLDSIIQFKHGVFFKNNNSQVTTSANLAVFDLENNIIKIGVRSSKKEEENIILDYLKEYAKQNNYDFTIQSSQPGFETSENSVLIKNIVNSYKQVIKKCDLNLKPVHITVECGFFKEKIKDLDVAIISPNIIGAHTIEERVSIESIIECDKWLYQICKNVSIGQLGTETFNT